MIKLYKTKLGHLIKEESYLGRVTISLDGGKCWKILDETYLQRFLNLGIAKLIGNNFRLK